MLHAVNNQEAHSLRAVLVSVVREDLLLKHSPVLLKEGLTTLFQSVFGLLFFPTFPRVASYTTTCLSQTQGETLENAWNPEGIGQPWVCGVFHLVACGYLGFQSVQRENKLLHAMSSFD